MTEEWVELTDGNQKLLMTRRELNNLAHRISRIFASVRAIPAPFLNADAMQGRIKVEPLLEVSVARWKFDRRRKEATK